MSRLFTWPKTSVLMLMLLGWCSDALGFPYELSYSGRLTDSSGQPLTNTVDLEVKFFRSETGDDAVVGVAVPIFSHVHLNEGVFQLNIALTGEDFHKVFDGSNAAWIQITDLSRGISYPRQKFTVNPYALKVPVDDATITFNNQGKLTLDVTGGAAGQVLSKDGSGNLVWATPAGSGDLLSAANLSDLSDASQARNNLQLGTAATANIGTGAGDVAAGIHAHPNATTTVAGFMSATDKSKLDGIASGAGVDTDSNAKTLCGDGAFLAGNDGSTTCKTAAEIVSDGSGVSTADTGSVTSNMILDGTITADDIANNTVTANKIAGNSLTAAEIATGAVGSDEILNASIIDVDVAANAAIAGGKITPNFGSQNVVTTGSVTANESKLKAASNTGVITLKAPDNQADDKTFTLPGTYGTSGQYLKSDGAGGLAWDTLPAGGGGDMLKADNLSGLANTATARSNLGLGDSAILDVGSTAGTVAAGNHTHTAATTSADGFMSATDKTKLDGIAAGAGVDTNAKTLCGDGMFLSGDALTSCHSPAAIVFNGNGVRTSDSSVISSAMITNGAIVNDDINNAAAIAGSKISPDFGAQRIETSAGIKIGADATACNGTNEGSIRYNTSSKRLEYCNSSAWTQVANGDGVPTGTIAYFTTACPTGWTEYTAARGRYVVGLPSGGTATGVMGTALSNLENRATGAHTHLFRVHSGQANSNAIGGGYVAAGDMTGSPIWQTTYTHENPNLIQSPTGAVAGTNAPYIQLRACSKS